LQREDLQSIVQGKATDLYFLEKNNIKATLTNYDARMVSLLVPDKNGDWIDVNAGVDTIEKYVEAKDQCYGAVVDRYAGRIAAGNLV
jgi:aldose 1-epimerase